MTKKRAGPNDAIIGQTIRALRLSKGVSQGGLAKCLGVSFQQIQKYERGLNRVGASRLVEIAKTLDVPIAALLHGLDGIDCRPAQSRDPLALLASGLAMRLTQAFSKIRDRRFRLALVQLTEKIASEGR